MDTLAVFRSRSEALLIFKRISNARIACSTVNTPVALGYGCGISIIFHHSQMEKIKLIIQNCHSTSFIGFFNK